jgi:hypothetical protein
MSLAVTVHSQVPEQVLLNRRVSECCNKLLEVGYRRIFKLVSVYKETSKKKTCHLIFLAIKINKILIHWQ